MKVKIDTKEKFHVIALKEPTVYANMTVNMEKLLLSFLKKEIKNVILKMNEVSAIEIDAAHGLVKIQQRFYENDFSLVICELQQSVEDIFENLGLLEQMNVTPTESEAWDIIQMEEIERELMGGL